MPGISIRDALIAEAEAICIDPTNPPPQLSAPTPEDPPPYAWLNSKNRAALCLSGGGIRSAAFALGVIQALANHPRQQNTGDRVPPAVREAEKSLLRQFDFLSTVGGGGYTGSWLSAWIRRVGYGQVWSELIGRPAGSDSEPEAITNLRLNCNYLMPRLGILSADSWTTVALYIRGLLSTWLLVIPALCLVLLALKWFAIIAVSFSRDDLNLNSLILLAPITGGLCMIVALAFVAASRPTYQAITTDQFQFLYRVMLPVILAAMWFSALFLSPSFERWLDVTNYCGVCSPEILAAINARIGTTVVVAAMVAGSVIYGGGWLAAGLFGRRLPARQWRDGMCFTLCGMVYGLLVGLGVWLLQNYAEGPFRFYAVLWLCLPWLLLAQMVADNIFLYITSYQRYSGGDGEWLGRAAGWYIGAALLWLLIFALTYYGSAMLAAHPEGTWTEDTRLLPFGSLREAVPGLLASVGGVSGFITALLRRDSNTSRKLGNTEPRTLSQVIADNILVIAAPIFGAILIIALSYILDLALLGHSFFESLLLGNPLRLYALSPHQIPADHSLFSDAAFRELLWLDGGSAALILVAALASWQININGFSVHALYRNRLIQAFLGATNWDRQGDPLTNFDARDNLPMQELRPGRGAAGDRGGRPFHVLNLTLNAISTKSLALQKREAASFTVSPLHVGTRRKGYRDSALYAGFPGITLGTAMAISGIGSNTRFGYASSPAIAIVMSLFNVRLGWWLGNTGKEGDKSFTKEGPGFALKWFALDLFGLTTDQYSFVYLSDGGHFENLGLYEMVRRRCRYIVISDAGCDPDFSFEDLGNAVRKIEIDLGVRITFDSLQALKPRSADGAPDLQAPYHCVGIIHYAAADGEGEDGKILYIKPSYHGTESVGVRAYALAHGDFPHEPTRDQWFSESQFESYRKLGYEITDRVLTPATKKAARKAGTDVVPTLAQIFDAL